MRTWKQAECIYTPNATESFDLNLGQLGLGCYISMHSTVQNYYLTDLVCKGLLIWLSW